MFTVAEIIFAGWFAFASFHRFYRAVEFCFSASGITIALGLSFLVESSRLLLFRPQRGLRDLMKTLRKDWEMVLMLPCMFWISVLVYFLLFQPVETFLPEEISKCTENGSVGIIFSGTNAAADSLIDATPSGSGFWVGSRGYFVTWTQPSFPVEKLTVCVLLPTDYNGEQISTFGNAFLTGGTNIIFHQQTGIEILYVPLNPFSGRAPFYTYGDNSKDKHGNVNSVPLISGMTLNGGSWCSPMLQREKYSALPISDKPVSVGQSVFLIAAEPGTARECLSLSFRQGTVTSIHPNGLEVFDNDLRINTTLPFSLSYRGAPVLDSTKSIVGVVSGESETTCVLIPSQYLLRELKLLESISPPAYKGCPSFEILTHFAMRPSPTPATVTSQH